MPKRTTQDPIKYCKYGRTGTLWEGRYKSSLVQSENYLLTVYRYIELNPVRANMLAHAFDYPWSSYRFNGVGLNIQLLTPHCEYANLGNAPEGRQKAYRARFRGRMAIESQGIIVKEQINDSDPFDSTYLPKLAIGSKVAEELVSA